MLFYLTICGKNFDVFLFLIVWILQINHLAKYRSTVNAFYGRLKIRFTPPWNHTNQIPQIFWQNSHTIANKEQYQQNLQQLSIFSHIIVLHDNKYMILLLRISEFGLLFKFNKLICTKLITVLLQQVALIYICWWSYRYIALW